MHSVSSEVCNRVSDSSRDAIGVGPRANALAQSATSRKASGVAGISTDPNETAQRLHCPFNSSQQQTATSGGPSPFSPPASSPSDNPGTTSTALDGVSHKLSLAVSGLSVLATQPARDSAPVQANADWPYPELGPIPFMSGPTGSGPAGSFGFNPTYFPTKATAEAIAQMLGGKVVAQDSMLTAQGSPFGQNQPNYMVELPNGNVFNPGPIAQAISVKQPRAMIDALIYSEVNNTPVEVGQAPPFVPANSTSSDTTFTAVATDAQSPAAGAPQFSLPGSGQFISPMYAQPGNITAADDPAVSASERMQTILKMMKLVSQISSLGHAAQRESRAKRAF